MNFEHELPKSISIQDLLNHFDLDLPEHLMDLKIGKSMKKSKLTIDNNNYTFKHEKKFGGGTTIIINPSDHEQTIYICSGNGEKASERVYSCDSLDWSLPPMDLDPYLEELIYGKK